MREGRESGASVYKTEQRVSLLAMEHLCVCERGRERCVGKRLLEGETDIVCV